MVAVVLASNIENRAHRLGIDLQFKLWERIVGETHLVRAKWSSRWWKAETRRSSGDGSFGLQY